jgi:GTP-binding protein
LLIRVNIRADFRILKAIMKNYYQRAQFLTSASKASQFPQDNRREVAFAGRSNAGKSSAINTLCMNKSLARTSKTPGRTQLINFFPLDEERCLVDLPGYGYAKVPEAVRREWQSLMEDYLSKRENLAGLVMIMDIRHPLKDYDLQMLEWCQHFGTPVHILLTKADKLKKGPASQSLLQVRKTLKEEGIDATVQIFSALNKTGLEELQGVLNGWYQLESE